MTLESTVQERSYFNVLVTYNGQSYILVSFVDTILTAQTDLLKGLHGKVEALQLSGQQMKQLIQGGTE